MDSKATMIYFAQHYLEELHVGVVVTDGEGFIIYISDSCKDLYGIEKAKSIKKHISHLEEQGTFYPSAGLRVLRERKKVTVVQPDRYGEQLLVTGVPIFDEAGNLEYIITYSSWDVSNYNELTEKYNNLKKEHEKTYYELNELRKKDMRFDLVSKSKKMAEILKLVEKIASTDINVILIGEPGAGKGLMAKEIHKKSNRAKEPFIQVNCSTFKNNILIDELFGYFDKEKGNKEKIGLCEMASKGTMLLEDIECLDMDIQKKLLYLIKNQYYFKPGSENIVEVDTRIIATTSRDLVELVEKGEFNKELYYRLNIASINYPSLRERQEDIVPFLELFVDKFNQKYSRNKRFSEQACNVLSYYEWPGNVCELKYLVQKMVLTIDEDLIQGYHLPSHVSPYASSKFKSEMDLKEYLEHFEKKLVLQAYEKHATSVGVAGYLGISQATAVRKLQKYVSDYTSHRNAEEERNGR